MGWGMPVSASSHAAAPHGGLTASGIVGKLLAYKTPALTVPWQEIDAVPPEGGAFPTLTIQGHSCLHPEHGKGPQLLGLGASREAKTPTFEPRPTPSARIISFCRCSFENVYGAPTEEQFPHSMLDNISPEGKGVQSV